MGAVAVFGLNGRLGSVWWAALGLFSQAPCVLVLMIVSFILSAFLAVSVRAEFFHFDSISNASTYYFNYLYCHVWEGECQPNQDDATQQGRQRIWVLLGLMS